jgi:Holliday junction resolvase RusA-like endonuclease
MTFAMVLPRRPISAKGRLNEKYHEAIHAEAQQRHGGKEMLKGELYCRISWFHKEATTQDVDNIAKRIIDALKGVVFPDAFRSYPVLLVESTQRENIGS